jgi:hypothetical protein
MGHPAGSLAVSQALESLDKIFGRDRSLDVQERSCRTLK